MASDEVSRVTADSLFEGHQSKRHLLAIDACNLITVGIVVRPASYYTQPDKGVPALRSVNVFPGRFDLSDLVYLTVEGNQKNAKSQLKEGDVVVVRTGRPGDAAVVSDGIDGMNLIDLILVRPKSLLLPEYLAEFLNSSFGRRKILRGSAGTAQQHFNVSEFERLALPAPTVREQVETVEKLKSLRAKSQLCQDHTRHFLTLQTALVEVLIR